MIPEFIIEARTIRFFVIRFLKMQKNVVENIEFLPLVSRHEIHCSAAATLGVSH